MGFVLDDCSSKLALELGVLLTHMRFMGVSSVREGERVCV